MSDDKAECELLRKSRDASIAQEQGTRNHVNRLCVELQEAKAECERLRGELEVAREEVANLRDSLSTAKEGK